MIEADVRAIITERSPCDGCRFADRCRAADLACDAFRVYAQGGVPIRWPLVLTLTEVSSQVDTKPLQ